MEASTKRQAILDAAHDQFRQYGFRKTSMDDIARGLDISRASLYSYFENKDEIFRCVSKSIHELALDHASAWLQDSETQDLVDRVAGALLARHGPFFQAVAESPHGAELYDEYSRLCGDVVNESHARLESMLASTLKDAAARGEIDLRNSGLSAAEVAGLLNLATAGLKRGASDMKRFETRVRNLTKVMMAGLTPTTG